MSCSRYPVNVKAVGLMQCRKQKNYMIFVSWSDQNNILIYRTFEDFKRFHKELKRKFPIEGGSLRRSDRTIPRFRVWACVGKGWQVRAPSSSGKRCCSQGIQTCCFTPTLLMLF
uniref:NADPH oxidase organizer 1 n=1 Tax=Athene cunicularia TaxID=194338 RepID=A0A663LKS3_ATHCN